jgi:PPOX class probable F420-dependent enzyme
MITAEQREFLESNRLCILGYARKDGPPALSPVYYYLDGDDIVISTTALRAKGRAGRRNTPMSVCVIGEQSPFPYLTVYGSSRVEETGAVDAMMRIGEKMTGAPISEASRPAIEQRARDEGRLVLRITAEHVVSR